MTWRLAKSLDVLRKQINKAAPKRSKASDGTVGDAKHASRSSDHNPWVKDGKTGVVTALDITNDPAHGINSEELAEALRASKDSRIKYVLSNRKIFAGAGGQSPWKWRQYSGANPHNKHVHISVKSAKSSYDSDKPWDIALPGQTASVMAIEVDEAKPAPAVNVEPGKKAPRPAFPARSKSETFPAFIKAWDEAPDDADPEVFLAQWRLKAMKYNPGGIDGRWGGMTAGAITGFNNDKGRIVAPKIDKVFLAALDKAEAEGFTRPIAEERADPTDEKLALKAPEIVPIKHNRVVAFFAAAGAFLMSVFNAIVSFFKDALEWLTPVKDFASDVPTWVWLAVAGAVALFIGVNSAKGVNRITESVQTGERP